MQHTVEVQQPKLNNGVPSVIPNIWISGSGTRHVDMSHMMVHNKLRSFHYKLQTSISTKRFANMSINIGVIKSTGTFFTIVLSKRWKAINFTLYYSTKKFIRY